MNIDNLYQAVISKKLNYNQKKKRILDEAEKLLQPIDLTPEFKRLYQDGVLCDLFEGPAPYRPRYVMPDYGKYLLQGSSFLGIKPASNLQEALTALQIIYYHVPSITGKPVYLGNLDQILNRFIVKEDYQSAKKQIENFMLYLDKTIANAYSHANLGPEETEATKLILEVISEMKLEVPNLSFMYDAQKTSDYIAEEAIRCGLVCGNPGFANHNLNQLTYPGQYGISSCYNVLPVGGGAYTLSRIVLPRLAKQSLDIDHFLNVMLPEAVRELANYINSRVKFLVEESGYFETDFMTKEGIVERERFLPMFGIAGLADCVNELMISSNKKYGKDKEANELAAKILERIEGLVDKERAIYSEITAGKFLLHAQAGLSDDFGVTSGVRIRVGDEPDSIYDHLRHSAFFHRPFVTGCSDIFPFETTANKNISAILDLIKGAFSIGDRYIALYSSDSELVRITGYLIKKSDMEKYLKGEVILQDNVINGSSNYINNRLDQRKVRSING